MTQVLKFLKGSDFSRAVIMGIAITVPLVLGIRTGYVEVGVVICLGAFWSFPSNVKGSFRNKAYGVLIATALITLVTLLIGYLKGSLWLVIPTIGLLAFGIAYLSLYGFRASLISFSGLLALVLNFAETSTRLAVPEKALLIAAGGFWYLLLITLWHLIRPREHVEELFAEAFERSAKLLRLRAALLDPGADQRALQNELLKVQAGLIDNHETLRSTLIPRRARRSDDPIKDRYFSMFILLVELLETAVAHPVNFAKMNRVMTRYPVFVAPFQALIGGMSSGLRALSAPTTFRTEKPDGNALETAFQTIRRRIDALENAPPEAPEKEEVLLIVKNFFFYQQRQYEKIKKLQSLSANTRAEELETIERATAQRFLSRLDFSPRLLRENFTFRSEAFRHALRLALSMVVGYALGNALHVQNPYWILLTIIVIIRPSYGLTRDRFKQRIIGTFIGAGIAALIVVLTQNPYVYGAVAIVALVVAFTRLQSNYRTAATFITISIITIYAIIAPDVIAVIQYRIIDTLIGAGISLAAVSWLWPYWGYRGVRKQIRNSITANAGFLRQITEYALSGARELPVTYSLARKNAFTEVAKLSNAYQEMAQEPPSKQKNIDRVYEFVVLNHNFLSSLSSFSTYVKNGETGTVPERSLPQLPAIHDHLENTLNLLRRKPSKEDPPSPIINSVAAEDRSAPLGFREAYLIKEQLAWMKALAVEMEALATRMG